MKYVVSGITTNKREGGNGYDAAGSLTAFPELGWELMITRLHIIDMLQSEVISEDDIIITTPDRYFLYNNIFKNVSTWNKTTHTEIEPFSYLNIPRSDIIDLTEVSAMEEYLNRQIWEPRYKYFDRDLDLLLKIDTSIERIFNTAAPFVCILARFRTWCSERNTDVQYLNDMIDFLHNIGIGVFVFGEGAENELKNTNANYVNLQEACHLMGHQNCKFVYGAYSGAMHLGFFCCKSKLLIHLFDFYNAPIYHPLYFGRGVNFTGISVFSCDYSTKNADWLKYL